MMMCSSGLVLPRINWSKSHKPKRVQLAMVSGMHWAPEMLLSVGEMTPLLASASSKLRAVSLGSSTGGGSRAAVGSRHARSFDSSPAAAARCCEARRSLLAAWQRQAAVRGAIATSSGSLASGTTDDKAAGAVQPAISLCAALSLLLGVSVWEPSPAAAAPSWRGGIVQEFSASILRTEESFDGGYGTVAAPLRAAPILDVASAEAACGCEETYGLLPCSTTVGGNLFLMLVYGYVLFTAATFISEGSELLLEVMNPGLLGGLVLPILGALPDALLICVSGTAGSVQQAQQEVMVGVGVLAGSTVMILTVAWAGSLVAGRCDLSGPDGTAKDLTLSRGFDLNGTGVTTDEQTRLGARIMAVSVLPYLCVQIPLIDGQPGQGSVAALAGSLLAFAGLLAYSAYQVASPWLQQKRIQEARLQFVKSRALEGVSSFTSKSKGIVSKIVSEGGLFNSTLLKELFNSFDKNKDGKIEGEELRGLIVGLDLDEEGSIPAEEQVETWLAEFDRNEDGTLSQNEFVTGIVRWATRMTEERRSQQVQMLEISGAANFWAAQSLEAKKILELLESEAGGSESGGGAEAVDASSIYTKAVLYLGAGAALAAVFADPMVDTIGGFSTASGVPPFFVAFIVTPFASNASELLSSIFFALKRRKRNISLTLSQVYGAVTMNNTLCLGLFLALVYSRGLTWDFSSEVTVIVCTVVLVGAIAGSRTTFPLWWAAPVLALYPVSIAGVAALDTVLGWR